jgi:hypothetical protein
MAKAYRRHHSGPIAEAAAAIGAETATPTTPAIDIRAFTVTRLRPFGSSRGAAAARVTL